MRQITLKDRLRYIFDNIMAKGTVAQIIGLALMTLLAVVLFSLIVWGMGITAEENLIEQIWSYLSLTLEADPHTGEPWLLRLSAFAITLVAIFITSILIGLLATGIEEKIEDLRKGRSLVIESDHTVILGWNASIFPIISELIIANQNRKSSSIVILGEKDKVEMEDEIRDRIGHSGNTKIVCRTGSPMEMSDLEIVSLNTSRSILVLGPESAEADVEVIKTLMAIAHNPERREEPYHIVAEIDNRKNFVAARIAGQDEVELLLGGDLIARITAQTSRQSGLSMAYIELLDFGGDEIYTKEEPALAGKTFGEALLAYEDSTVIGLIPKGGKPKLNPPMDTEIQAEDQVIAISEDDDTLVLSGMTALAMNYEAIRPSSRAEKKPEKIIILGWNWRAPIIINELDRYMAKGSKVLVMADYAQGKEELGRCCTALKNIELKFKYGDTTDRKTLEELPLQEYQQLIVLSYAGLMDAQRADARTLVTLLHLRDIKEKGNYQLFIVSEILDVRNQSLAEVAQADDFVISERIISLMLAQISENKHLGAIFEDVLDSEGSEIYIKPAGDFVAIGEAVNFYTVVDSARRRNQVAIGYRIAAQAKDHRQGFGVVLNPDKSKQIVFEDGDRIIVIAED